MVKKKRSNKGMESSPSAKNPLCSVMTRKGTPCQLPAKVNGRCWIHAEEKTDTSEDNLLDFNQIEHPVVHEEEDKSAESRPESQFKQDDKDIESEEFIEMPEDSGKQQEGMEEKAVSDDKAFGPDQDNEDSEIKSLLENIEVLDFDEESIDGPELKLKLEMEDTPEPEDRPDKEPDEPDTVTDQDNEESEIQSLLEDIKVLDFDEEPIDGPELEIELEMEESPEPEDRPDKPDEPDTVTDQDTEKSEIDAILEDIEVLDFDEESIDGPELKLKLEMEDTPELEDRPDKEPDEPDIVPDQDIEQSAIDAILEDIEILEIDEEPIDVTELEQKFETEETQLPDKPTDKGPDESDAIKDQNTEEMDMKSILEILGIDDDTTDSSDADLEAILESLEIDEDASPPSPLEIQQETEETWKFEDKKDFEADYDSEERFDFSTTVETETHAEETVNDVTERHRESDADIKEMPLSGHKRFRKKRLRIPLPALVFIAILLFVFFNNNIFHLVASIFESKIQDAGNLKINPFAITSKFVKNADDGQLFVLKGWVKNEYDNPRSFISVKGNLFTKDNYSKTEIVYCGNVLSSEELSSLSLDDIKMRLSNRFGEKQSNISVKTGAILPFMIVFGNLPDNLENLDKFSIEIIRSSPS